MEMASQEILFEHPSSPIAFFKRIDVSQLNIDWNKIDSVEFSVRFYSQSLVISSLSVKTVQSSRHFHRAHFVLLNSHSKPALYDLFYTSLHQAFPEIPLISAGMDGEMLLIPITIDYETVFVTIRDSYTQGERINYDIYWAVASLSTVRRVMEEIRKRATRAYFLCLQYPDELIRPLNDAVSPLFYSYEISLSDVNLDYFCTILEREFYRVFVYSESVIGYVDGSLKEFVQISLKEKVIRLMNHNTKSDIFAVIEIYKVVCQCMDSLLVMNPFKF